MLFVYILFSESKSKFYIGQTNDIGNRINRHNSSYELSTKHGVPWKIVTFFTLESRSEAIVLEKKIKKRGAKRYLQDIGFFEQ